jgi:hypothetical protein
MLQIIKPVALVLSFTRDIYKDTESIGLVVDPVALIDIAVGVCHSSPTIGLPVHPLTFIFGAVRPKLQANTLPLASSLIPLPLVLLLFAHILELIYVDSVFF